MNCKTCIFFLESGTMCCNPKGLRVSLVTNFVTGPRGFDIPDHTPVLMHKDEWMNFPLDVCGMFGMKPVVCNEYRSKE